jgi:hypothetical protein
MGGSTGNIRTPRLSATGGTRTFSSILSDSASAGAGSSRRTLAWYKRYETQQGAYKSIFDIQYGQFRSDTRFFLKGAI